MIIPNIKRLTHFFYWSLFWFWDKILS
jgi:hypothetical protein